MSQSKDPSQEEIDALLAAAEEAHRAGEFKEELSSIEQFIIALNIKPGKSYISSHRLWTAYNMWANFPLEQDTFYKEFSRKFCYNRAKVGPTRGYKLDPESFKNVPTSYIQQQKILADMKIQRYDSRIRKSGSKWAL